ncbi:Pollen Ole e 1 allergen/extensin [Macleaya cordata]|uniref:Pollen Ole e 1 allergen/extensin n=1 Tax=Macleaya cordata TaxID=56857 RepID=A0A200QPF6_MACCD|nr:Pollen Ole e 1 allergen/extensin [Macleaya cordata]
MAIPSAFFIIISLLFFVGNVPSAVGLILNGKSISAVNLGGIVSCVDQNLPVNQPPKVIPGAPVDLYCKNGPTDTLVNTVTTDVTGTYLFIFNLLDTILFDPNTCYIIVRIPPTTCALPVPNAVLRAPICVLDVVQALLSGLLGNLLTCIAGPAYLVG